MSEHTPAPWRIERDPYPHVRGGPNDSCVLASDYSTEADERLVVAAPDLLAALEVARDYVADGLASDDQAIRESTPTDLAMIDAAIAKATA